MSPSDGMAEYFTAAVSVSRSVGPSSPTSKSSATKPKRQVAKLSSGKPSKVQVSSTVSAKTKKLQVSSRTTKKDGKGKTKPVLGNVKKGQYV